MAYAIHESESYRADVEGAVDYLVSVLHSPKAAIDLLDALEHVYEELQNMPSLYAVSRKPELARKNCRERLVGGYAVVYRLDGEEVFLLRLFHQSQLIERAVVDWDD